MPAAPLAPARGLVLASSLGLVAVTLLGWAGVLPVGRPGAGPSAVTEPTTAPAAPSSSPAPSRTPASPATTTARPAPGTPRLAGMRPDRRTLPARSGTGRRVVLDLGVQRVWLVRPDGSVARTYRVSGSRYDQLAPGRYRVWSVSRHTKSWNGDERLEYMVRFARGKRAAIGFHSIPVTPAGRPVQTTAQLGIPLSDGCFRQARADARAMWEFAPVGTTVVVVDSLD